MKKILLSLGTCLMVSVPVISAISCNSEKQYITNEPEYTKDITKDASSKNFSIWEEIKNNINSKIDENLGEDNRNKFGVDGQNIVIEIEAKDEDYLIVSAFIGYDGHYKKRQIDLGNILFLKYEKDFETSVFVVKVIAESEKVDNWNKE